MSNRLLRDVVDWKLGKSSPYRESAEMPDYTDPTPINWVPFKRFVAWTVLVSAAEAVGYVMVLGAVAMPPAAEHIFRTAAFGLMGVNSLIFGCIAVGMAIRWAIRTIETTEPSSVNGETK